MYLFNLFNNINKNSYKTNDQYNIGMFSKL